MHYLANHLTVQRITLATSHLIYVRDANGGHQAEPLVVAIDVSGITFLE